MFLIVVSSLINMDFTELEFLIIDLTLIRVSINISG